VIVGASFDGGGSSTRGLEANGLPSIEGRRSTIWSGRAFGIAIPASASARARASAPESKG
jgi:hypothetical protein